MRHLRPWHDFVKKCYINDVDFVEHVPETGRMTVDGEVKFVMPVSCLRLPEWTKHVTDDARLKFQERAAHHLGEAWTKYRELGTKEFPFFTGCAIDECGSINDPGYPLTSTEECMMHLREVHGADDQEIAEVVHAWETKNALRYSSPPYNMNVAGELLTPRDSRKRGPVETVDNVKVSKRSRQ